MLKRQHGHAARTLASVVLAALLAGMGAPSMASPGACTIVGTAAADTLSGTDGPDVICGGEGDDVIYGFGGDDVLRGENGNDTIHSGYGNDTVEGGNGDDTIFDDSGANTLDGGNGSDTIVGGDGPDRIDGGNDDDSISSGDGDDQVFGQNGGDLVDGGPGIDRLEGGNGDDLLFGGGGADSLLGEAGNDELWGGGGLDAVDGGRGDDQCSDLEDVTALCELLIDAANLDTDDVDSDIVPNAVELVWGTDPHSADSDGDGLSDSDEVQALSDPLAGDSDGDGVADGDEDLDGDGIADAVELASGTNLARTDSDRDSVTDAIEIAAGTDPANADSDGDGLDDGHEAQLGSDPKVADSDGDGLGDAVDTFVRIVDPTASGATLKVEAPGETALDVHLVDSTDVSLDAIPGLVSTPVEVLGAVGATGTLTIPLKAGIPSGARLAVLHLDESTGALDIPTDQSVDLVAGTATVTTSAFSPFVVVDLDAFDAAWALNVAPPEDGGSGSARDVVVIVDSSYSMRTSDPDFTRLDIARRVIDGLADGDRAGFSCTTCGHYVPLTFDHQAARSGVNWVFSYYNNDLTRSLDRALAFFGGAGSEGRERVIVLISDGSGAYSNFVLARARNLDTSIHTVELGASWYHDRLQGIASGTGGTFTGWGDGPALEDLIESLGTSAPVELDTDGDGLDDLVETGGIWSTKGTVYRTDPLNRDTDGDGLEDGSEVGELTSSSIYPGAPAYRILADPTDPDSDNDGLGDAIEVANLIYAFDPNSDHDDLNDYEEWETHGTDPMGQDTDEDGFDDDFEVLNFDQGFDPLFFDDSYEWWEYLGDFARGALCGSIDWGLFCEGTTIAFLTGQIAAGFAAVGDVRDALFSIVTGDLVGASLSAFGIIPLLGDGAKAAGQIAKFTKRLGDTPQVALRFIGRSTGIPSGVRIQALDEAFDGAATALKNRGLDEDSILNFARRGMSPKHVESMLDSAKSVVKGTGKFTREIDAEDLLRASLATADTTKFATKNAAGQVRFYDVTSIEARIAYEVKHGKVPFAGRARVQAQRDADYLANLPQGARFDSIRWTFYADRSGVVGPDEDLLAFLVSHNIPYEIHLP